MILTVTLNTALDITYRVPALVPHASHRVTDVAERPGGKGVNVARVLAALGHDTVVTGFAGGPTGAVLRDLLAPLGPVDALIPVAGNTRRTIAVADATTGDTTQLNEPGPAVTPEEWAAFLTSYAELLGDADAVALCGSLPPGIHVGAYGELIRRARAAGVPVLLDTSGEPLRRGIAARPDLVKPNADELAQLTGSREPLRAAHDARRRGAHAVVASLGADGMLAATPEGRWQAVPPARVKGNPTGAGDSAVAGLLSGLVERLPWPERLARAVALSAATVLAPAAGEFDTSTYEDLLPRVEVTAHATAA
ncbi:1-phosphofructokinase [Streptomyces agglomeratus]|uniref:1-phosphofructokinase family hexose kinase n=1 Tax=Streptomyces agglomeratus TaxID=285458 RepID=UPI000854BB2F|nr:1-phosphofructokinase family hexose kinase [Streptomyces agglomeratus]OEJ39644.1 1-phosphofructokinase [Streptomyces agglomeratus]OEJ45972.1 1-phosphofructokinase [Streptomyces agglomeratus]